MGLVRAKNDDSGATAVADEKDENVLPDGSRVISGDEGDDSGSVPNLAVGERVQVTHGDYAGRMGVILRIEYADDAAFLQANTPNHPNRAFAEVGEYIVRTRDAQSITISVKPDEVKQLTTIDGWARGQI